MAFFISSKFQTSLFISRYLRPNAFLNEPKGWYKSCLTNTLAMFVDVVDSIKLYKMGFVSNKAYLRNFA